MVRVWSKRGKTSEEEGGGGSKVGGMRVGWGGKQLVGGYIYIYIYTYILSITHNLVPFSRSYLSNRVDIIIINILEEEKKIKSVYTHIYKRHPLYIKSYSAPLVVVVPTIFYIAI
jgi:hypothetical protein